MVNNKSKSDIGILDRRVAAILYLAFVFLCLMSVPGMVLAEPAAAPVATPPGGTYADSVSVELTTATSGGAIHYTTDGSDPTAGSSLYDGTPLVFTVDTTLKAITIASGFEDSAVTPENYTIQVGFQPAPGPVESLPESCRSPW